MAKERSTSQMSYGNLKEDGGCCVAGDHFMTSTDDDFIRRSLSLSMDSAVNIDISDLGVGASLQQCQKTIIAPYACLLTVIGWRPWFQDSLGRRCNLWILFNWIYPLLVVSLVVCHYVFQVIGCQGKFNIHQDVQSTPAPPQEVRGNCTWGFLTFSCHVRYIVESLRRRNDSTETHCHHIVPAYVVPGCIHLAAYAYGIRHFRVLRHCEPLFSLMERVFLHSHTTRGLQRALIRNSRLFFFGALLWMLSQIGVEILYSFTFQNSAPETISEWGWAVLRVASRIVVAGVDVAATLNYTIQCEALLLHIQGICLRLREKAFPLLRDAMHEVLGVREYVSLLNGSVAKMTALCAANFAQLTVLGTALLFVDRAAEEPRVLAYRAIFPMLWLIALLAPLIQAARLTRAGRHLRHISLEIRVFGYGTAPPRELDAFLLFISGATLRAKLFGVTVRPATVLLSIGLTVFVLLILMVVDLLSVSGYEKLF